MSRIPERFIWAVEIMEVRTANRILEIGCGPGILAELIGQKLVTGSYLGIDRSASMIDKARFRNRLLIAKNIAAFMTADFSKAALPADGFDLVVAFNVNLFLRDSSSDLEKIRKALRPGGSLFVFYQFPYEISVAAANPVRECLERSSFRISRVLLQKLKPVSAICVQAKGE